MLEPELARDNGEVREGELREQRGHDEHAASAMPDDREVDSGMS